MKEYIKSYHVFLSSLLLKGLMYVVYPFVGIALLAALMCIGSDTDWSSGTSVTVTN